ncbi:hypothetical protein BH10CYA1_BH10CYA1_48180 [soil metagenome]
MHKPNHIMADLIRPIPEFAPNLTQKMFYNEWIKTSLERSDFSAAEFEKNVTPF